MFKIYIHHSKDLLGQTGDNGETVCVFLEHPKNPLQSMWAWFFDVDKAQEFIKEMKTLEITLNQLYFIHRQDSFLPVTNRRTTVKNINPFEPSEIYVEITVEKKQYVFNAKLAICDLKENQTSVY